MYYLKQLLGENVTNMQEHSVGEIQNLSWSKQLNACVITTPDGEYILSASNKKLAANEYLRQDGDSPAAITPMQKIYNLDGKLLGEAEDAEFNNALKLTGIISGGKTYPRGRIYAIGDVILIKNPPKKKAETTKKPQRQKPAPEQEKTEDNAAPRKTPEKNNSPYPIKRKYGDFSFLIGKTADKNITNFYGEIMLKRGEKITLDTLKKAKLSGKLIELCLHAK